LRRLHPANQGQPHARAGLLIRAGRLPRPISIL